MTDAEKQRKRPENAARGIGLYSSTYWLTSAVLLVVIVVSAVLFGRLLLSMKNTVSATAGAI